MSLNCNYSQLDMLQLSEVTVGRSYSCPNPVPEGHTETPQMNNTPQLLAEYIQYKYISQKMYVPQPCARRAQTRPLKLDIFCQQLWSVVQLGGVSVPFGHKVGA